MIYLKKMKNTNYKIYFINYKIYITTKHYIIIKMDWLTLDVVKNAKIYDGDQWTRLIIFKVNNNIYYHLSGGDCTGMYEDFQIILETKENNTDENICICPTKIFTSCKKIDQEYQNMPFLFLKKYFVNCFKYYVLENNFSLWTNTQQPPSKTLNFDIDPNDYNENSLIFDNDQLTNINNAIKNILQYHKNCN